MQILTNGIIAGLNIAILALAFTAVYLPSGVFHVALGGVYVIVPFIAWTGITQHWPWPVTISVAVLSGIVLSILCEIVNHARLARKAAPPAVHFISSLGLYIVMVQFAAMTWGEQTKVLRTGNEWTWHISSVVITRSQTLTAVLSCVVMVIMFLWLHRTGTGLQFRALASNSNEAALRGCNVRRLRLVAFGLAGGLGAISSLLVAMDLGFSPQGGLQALLLAVVAMIVGGRASLVGPPIGGILLGITRAGAVWFLSARWQEAATFLLLGLVLFLRPSGLLRRPINQEVGT